MDFDKVFTCLADMRVVDKARFELATSALRRQRSTGLIYLPIIQIR